MHVIEPHSTPQSGGYTGLVSIMIQSVAASEDASCSGKSTQRQYLELSFETKFKMSGHGARICPHFSKSAKIKIDVTPHEKRV